jgi:hypothetical protein
MTVQDLLLQEIPRTPEPVLTELYQYLQFLKSRQAEETFPGLALSHEALAKDWDTPEEDAAWANL